MINLPLPLLLPKLPPSKAFGLAKREYSTLSGLSDSSMNCTSVVLWGPPVLGPDPLPSRRLARLGKGGGGLGPIGPRSPSG
jgi:hypothetical protein